MQRYPCYAHLDKWTFSSYFLPYGSYLRLVTEDCRRLESVITKSLSAETLNNITRLYWTNQCERFHHRVFTNASNLCRVKEILSIYATHHAISLHLEWGNHVLIAKSLALIFFLKCAPFSFFITQRDILAFYHSHRKKTPKNKKTMVSCKM